MKNFKRQYYTNGTREIRIPLGETPPSGWVKGRVKSTVTTLNFKWYNNGEKEILSPVQIEDAGYVPGRLKFNHEALNKQHKALKDRHSHWYTNGEKNIQLPESAEIPEGFSRGYYVSTETRKKLSDAAKAECD